MSSVEKLIDKRLIDRNLRKGLINLEKYQQLLDQLVDRSDNVIAATDEACNPAVSETLSASAENAEPSSSPANPVQQTAP